MANINDTTTYPATAPALGDHVIGTDISDTGTSANGETVTFTWQGVMDLFEANMTVPTSVSGAYRTSTILASTSNAEGASLIGIEDAGTYWTGTTVEAALAEIGALKPAEAGADVTDANNVAAAGAVMNSDTTTAGMSFVIDEDTMASDLATKVPTQQSVKAYVDTTALLDSEVTNLAAVKAFDPSAYETVDADILRADTTDNLTVGFTSSVDDDGTQSSGTYTPDPATGNYKQITNGGAFTLAPPSPSNDIAVSVSVLIINNGSADTITTTGFTHVGPGDSFTTTDTHKFLCRIDVYDDGGTEYSVLQVVALQ